MIGLTVFTACLWLARRHFRSDTRRADRRIRAATKRYLESVKLESVKLESVKRDRAARASTAA